MDHAFTLHEIIECLSPTVPDTYTVSVRMPWPDEPDNYNQFDVKGYTSSANAIAAADVFHSLGDEIVLAFTDHGQIVDYVGQNIDVCIQRVAGSKHGSVRY